MSGAQQHHSVIDDAWDSVVGGFHWLKSVLLGEFEDNRPLSAIIADMLVSFIPAVVIATSARDAIAVILRMAKHPEKREEVLEWVLLCACLITIALPIAMAAAGVAAAGVGAVVGGIAGSELGAALRAVMLLLVKASTKLVDVIHFLQKFIKGDILKFLKAIKFAKYEQALLSAVRQFTGKLIEITQGLAKHLDSLSYFQYTKTLIAKLKTWERSFYAVQTAAIRKIPLAMAELDARLAKVLAETLPRETHVVPAGVKASKPKPATPPPQRVRDVPGRLLRDVDESAPRARASAKPAAGKASPPSHPSTPPPKPPDEKPTLKDKADDVPVSDHGANTRAQETKEPNIGSDDAGKTAGELKTNPKNIREAQKDWPAEKRARFATADEYYRSAGYTDYDNHLRGIDFDKPVDLVTLEKNEKLYQYSYLDRVTGEPKVGSYFYKDTQVDPGKLGFEVGGRSMIETELTSQSTFLRSSAANIEDWNGSGKIFEGGETQLFNPNASLSKPKVVK